MNILFLHQNFPGQFKYLAVNACQRVASVGGKVVCLGVEKSGQAYARANATESNLTYIQYKYMRSSSKNIHPWLQDSESKLIRGESCAAVCHELKKAGFQPDIIIQHSGWGEGLFLKLIYPDIPILSYQEFYYRTKGTDFDFDPEFQGQHTWKDLAKLQAKKASQLLSLEQATWNLTPTQFQKETFPKAFQNSFSVIHDGIDCNTIDSIPSEPHFEIESCKLEIRESDKVATCVMRSIEPYRGCHTLIRSIPYLQQLNDPSLQLIIVGNTSTISYGSPCPEGSWKDYFLKEIDGSYDPSRVHFVGNLAYQDLIKLLKRSNAHIYLTYPFVLSWSLLEAMACRCAIVGSNTAPVREAIADEQTGLLTDFFEPAQLAEQVTRLLTNPDLASKLGNNARKLIEEKYALSRCLPQQMALIELVANGILKQA